MKFLLFVHMIDNHVRPSAFKFQCFLDSSTQFYAKLSYYCVKMCGNKHSENLQPQKRFPTMNFYSSKSISAGWNASIAIDCSDRHPSLFIQMASSMLFVVILQITLVDARQQTFIVKSTVVCHQRNAFSWPQSMKLAKNVTRNLPNLESTVLHG